MKIIKSEVEDICLVECEVCNELETVEFRKFRRPIGSDFCEFIYKDYEHNFQKKLYYTKFLKSILKNDNKFRYNYNGIYINLDQVEDIYSSLFHAFESSFNEDEISYINKANINPLTLPSEVKDESFLLLFQSSEGMTFKISLYEKLITEVELGYIVKDSKNFTISKMLKYLFTKNNYMFDNYYLILLKSDIVEFLASINYLLNMVAKVDHDI